MFTYYDSVQNQARFGFAIAHALDKNAPVVNNFNSQFNDKLHIVVKELINARKPLIISGSSSGSVELIGAAFNIANALKNRGSEVGIVFVVSDVNSIGLSMIADKSLDDALDQLSIDNSNQELFTSLIVLENDLYRYANSKKINMALSKVDYFIVLDHQENFINRKADLILSATSFVESDGTVVNYEGRAQRFFRLYDTQYYDNDAVLMESWRWLYLINDAYRSYVRKTRLSIDYVIDSIVRCFPKLQGIKRAAPDSNFNVHGKKIAQAPHRYSGRAAMHAHINVHEPCVPPNKDTMFTFSMEGNHNNRSLHKQIPFVWHPGWNSPQAWNKFQNRIGEHVYPEDPGICLLDLLQNHNYNNKKQWFQNIPTDSLIIDKNTEHLWLIAPYWHLFGSEYTSQQSECIKKCMPHSYAMINLLDAEKLNVREGMFLKFTCSDQILCLPIKFSLQLPVKHIGLPIGFPGIPVFLSGMYAYDVQGVLCCDV